MKPKDSTSTTGFLIAMRLVTVLLFHFCLETCQARLSQSNVDSVMPIPQHSSGVYDQTRSQVNVRVQVRSKESKILSKTSFNKTGKDPSQWECYNEHRYCYDEYGMELNYTRNSSASCVCSSDCLKYGDCCVDAMLPTDESSSDSQVLYSCQMISTDTGDGYYYVYSHCPSDWVINDVRQQCETTAQFDSPKDPFLQILVTSAENNITYKNVFCAACNLQKRLIPWLVDLHCPEGKGDGKEASSNGTADSEGNSTTDLTKHVPSCPMKMKIPEGFNETLVPCRGRDISTCNPYLNNNNAQLNAKWCEKYFAPVIRKDKIDKVLYKNKYCAFCNGIKMNKLLCSMPGANDYSGSTAPTMTPSIFRIKPYSLLLDIDFMSGGTIVGTSKRCPAGSIFDPWTKVCRSVFCGNGAIYDDGICIRNSSTIIDGNSSTVVNASDVFIQCLKMVTHEPFTVDSNGTLEFINRGLVLLLGEYQIQDNDTVQICALTDPYVDKFGEDQGLLTLICTIISLVALFLKIVLHFVDPSPTKVAQKAIVSLSVALFLAQLFFLVGVSHSDWGLACTFIGIFIHYFFLTSFFWSNILAYDIWRTFACMKTPKAPSSCQSSSHKKIVFYSMYAWLTPLAFVTVAIIFDFVPMNMIEWKPNYGEVICWLSNRRALLIFFAAPLASLLAINICFFASTAFKISQAVKESKFAHQNTGKKDCLRFGLYVKLALIMGLTWTFGFVAPFSGSDVLWYLFIILNGLQGAFVFLAFTQFRTLWNQLVVKRKRGDQKKTHRSIDSSRSNLTTSTTNINNTNC